MKKNRHSYVREKIKVLKDKKGDFFKSEKAWCRTTTALEEFEKQEQELEREAWERTRGRNQGLER